MTRSFALILACGLVALAFAQPVVLKQSVLDGGGRSLSTSTDYRCGFSVGQTAASGWIAGTGYRAILGFWCRPFKTGGMSERQVMPAGAPAFKLGPCRPNPFGTRTTISYALPVEASVSLLVFDRAGRTIGTLVSARQTAGRYTVSWDISGVAESRLPSGVYFITFEPGDHRQVLKAVVAR
jgi:hypothetical protein